jgi:hypothetical protein
MRPSSPPGDGRIPFHRNPTAPEALTRLCDDRERQELQMANVTPDSESASDESVIEAQVVDSQTPSEPVVATLEPEIQDEPTAPAREVIYVTTPAAPRKLGNRGLGSGLALAAAVVFTALLALATAALAVANGGAFGFGFLAQPQFYVPALFFVIGFVLVVLIVNRAAWWAHIVGSIFVGLIVYFGTIGLGLLTTGIVQNTPAEAAERFTGELLNPFIIVAALLAREVSLWSGAILSRRGRRLRERNAEAHAAWQRELAETRAEGQRRAAEASGTV